MSGRGLGMNVELLKQLGNIGQIAGIRESRRLRGRGEGWLLVPVEPRSARELGMAVHKGEGHPVSLRQFIECAQAVLAELEPK